MIYEEKIHNIPNTKVIQHYVSPCVKCGCDDIKIEEYEDEYGFISTAKCTKCMQQIKEKVSTVEIIKSWNKNNNIETLITDKLKIIEITKEEIKSLKKIQTQRQKSVTKTKREGVK